MKLQVALDYMDLNRGLAVAAVVAPYVDVIEAGTSLLKLAGMAAVRELRARFPEHVIAADMKTADGGRQETEMAFAAGADISTVLGLVPDKAVLACLKAGATVGRTVYVDLLGTPRERWAQLQGLGVTHVIYHIGTDQQGERSLQAETVRCLRETFGFAVAVAGGVKPDALTALRLAGAEIAIIGSGITKAPDPGEAAQAFRRAMEG